MTDKNQGEPASPEKQAIEEARKAAAASMQLAMLTCFRQLLYHPDAREQHRFGPLIDWAVKLLGEVPLLDKFSISRSMLKRWISGESVPGTQARVSILERLEQLVQTKL